MTDTKYLTIPETAKKLGVNRKTVYRLIQRRDLDAIPIPPPDGDLRIPITELNRFIKWCHGDNTRSRLVKCPKCGWKF